MWLYFCRYELLESADGAYGIPDGQGGWNGLVGMVSSMVRERSLIRGGGGVSTKREREASQCLPQRKWGGGGDTSYSHVDGWRQKALSRYYRLFSILY